MIAQCLRVGHGRAVVTVIAVAKLLDSNCQRLVSGLTPGAEVAAWPARPSPRRPRWLGAITATDAVRKVYIITIILAFEGQLITNMNFFVCKKHYERVFAIDSITTTFQAHIEYS